MGIPRLLFLKPLFTKPTNSHFNLTRTLCSVPTNTPLSISPEFVKFVKSSPRSSVIPLLEQYFTEDKNVLQSEVPKIIRDLRKRKLFDHAIEVLEWANHKPVKHTDSSELSFHLDLIGKVRGIAAAEKFFEEANDHSERMYSSLLTLYVQGMLVDKSLSLFEKMKEMGIASSPLTYHKIMSLYLKSRQPDKLLGLLSEMQDKGVSPDAISYKMCLKACALTSDFDSMDKLVKAIKDQHHLSFEWLTYATVASYYLDGGHPEKAISCLQIAEDMVLEWTNRKRVRHTDSSDLPFHLDLIGKVRGIAAAEKFFEQANDHSEKMYNTLLNFYVQGMLVDKSLSLFEEMKKMGIASSPLTYNKIMSLYLKSRQPDKLLGLLSEMQDKGVSPDAISYKMCLKACSITSDFASMDKLVLALKDQHNLSFDWFTYATVAGYYLDGGHPKKAISCVRKAEDMVHDNPVGYTFLISSYAKLGDITKVTELWQKYKDASKSRSNHVYMVMLSSLIKLDMFEQAEGLLEEWKASGNEYSHLVLDALLSGYAQKGLVEKAEKLLEDQISKNRTPVPVSWGIISEGYVNCKNMQKATQCMKKALQLGPQPNGWAPKRAVISKILTWLGDNGDSDQVYEFLKLMSRVVPVDKNSYLTLKASTKLGKFVPVILQRLKDDNVDVDKVVRVGK